MIGRGRPPKLAPAWQNVLTLRQALLYVRGAGRHMAYPTLQRAIAIGQLPAFEDLLRHDRYGHPLVCILRTDLDAWLSGSLRPVQVIPLSA